MKKQKPTPAAPKERSKREQAKSKGMQEPEHGPGRLSPRNSRTPFVILGMLVMGPASGYALRQRIEQSVGNFWQESFGQLYPALDVLANSGLVEGTVQAKDGRDTRVWSITAAGRKELQSWIEQPPQAQRERNEMLLKFFFAELAPEAVGEHMARIQEQTTGELARLRSLRGSVEEQGRGQAALPLWLASIDYGIGGQHALVEWCRQARAALAVVAGAKAGGGRDQTCEDLPGAPRARRRT